MHWKIYISRFSRETGHFHTWIKDLTYENKVNVTRDWLFSHIQNILYVKLLHIIQNIYTLIGTLSGMSRVWWRADHFSSILDTCWVSIQGLHPWKDPAFVFFEGDSFGETLLTHSAVVKLDGLAFGAFPGCIFKCFTLTSRFLPPRPTKVTIYATKCRHFLFFSLLWGCEG